MVEHAALAGHGIRGTIEPGAKATHRRRHSVSTGHRGAIRAGEAFAQRRGQQGQAGELTGPRPRSCGGPRNGMPWSQRDAPTSTWSPRKPTSFTVCRKPLPGAFHRQCRIVGGGPPPHPLGQKRPPAVRKIRNFGLFFVYCRLFMRGYCPNAKLDSETVNDDCVVECADDYSSFPHP